MLYMGLFRAREFSAWKIPVRKRQHFPYITYFSVGFVVTKIIVSSTVKTIVILIPFDSICI